VSDCALDPKYIVFAYAAFLPEAEFEARSSEMTVRLPYREARDMFARRVRRRATKGQGGTQGSDPNSAGGEDD
jgi:hypothetical protein